MLAGIVSLLFLALVAGCGGWPAPPYAFRLLIPPTHLKFTTYFMPYWFWDEVGVYETFSRCQEERATLIARASEALAFPVVGRDSWTPEQRREYGRWRHARCVPLR